MDRSLKNHARQSSCESQGRPMDTSWILVEILRREYDDVDLRLQFFQVTMLLLDRVNPVSSRRIWGNRRNLVPRVFRLPTTVNSFWNATFGSVLGTFSRERKYLAILRPKTGAQSIDLRSCDPAKSWCWKPLDEFCLDVNCARNEHDAYRVDQGVSKATFQRDDRRRAFFRIGSINYSCLIRPLFPLPKPTTLSKHFGCFLWLELGEPGLQRQSCCRCEPIQ